MRRSLALGLAVLVLSSCREPSPDRKRPPLYAGSTPAAALDSLAGDRPVEVSVSGYVADETDGRVFLLDDGTGLARVALPDTLSAPTPLPVGTRMLAQGLLRRVRGAPLVEAEAWHYDSTAVPVRSP